MRDCNECNYNYNLLIKLGIDKPIDYNKYSFGKK